MFEGWGRAVHRRRWVVLGMAVVVLGFAGVWGSGVFGSLTAGGFDTPGSESARAEQVADRVLGRDDADVVVIYRSADLSVDSPRYRDAVTTTLGALPRRAVDSVTTYWSTGSADLVSSDRHSTYAVLRLTGADDDARGASYDAVRDHLDAPGLTEHVGGVVPTNEAVTDQTTHDVSHAEEISAPVLFVLLLVIFGSVAAASLPLAVGVTAVVGSFMALRLIGGVTDVSVYAINIVTLMGLGLAIDYGLFMVGRFREELRRTTSVGDALARTMATAGRTVAVSGVTVAVSLAGLLLFPQVFLRSMGFGGIAAVLVDMLAALTVLPALLAILGRRVDALSVAPLLRRLGLRRDRATARGASSGPWFRIASSVMRRPMVYVVVIVTGLLVLGSPFLRATWGGVDERVLPAGTPVRQTAEVLARDFPGNTTSPITAVVQLPGAVDEPAGARDLSSYVDRLRTLPGVTGADVTAASGSTARVSVRYDGAPLSVRARDLVGTVRQVSPPPGARVLVGGASAALADQLDSMGDELPWMALIVGTATFVLLFLAFGSVVLPVKAIVMNVLSLSATFGTLVWIFQDGHLSGFLDFTPTGTLEPSMPILLLAVVFGLSMDYEVFLLSRIREQYDRTGDNTASVAAGLQHTGGIITSAALLLCVVIAAFTTSGITFIKLTGVGMLVAVVVEATAVRVLLVPATMRLLGGVNWWAPGPLRRLYARYGIRETAEAPAPPTAARTSAERVSVG